MSDSNVGTGCVFYCNSLLVNNDTFVLMTLFNRWLGVQLNPHFMGVDLKYVSNFFPVFLPSICGVVDRNFEIGQGCQERFVNG